MIKPVPGVTCHGTHKQEASCCDPPSRGRSTNFDWKGEFGKMTQTSKLKVNPKNVSKLEFNRMASDKG